MTTPAVVPGEFADIFEPKPDRPVMTRPPREQASKKFIHEVAAELRAVGLDLTPDDAAKVADWAADKMERFGARTAQGVFTMDGGGPLCSWCGTIWPLCGCHHLSEMLTDEERENA
jgi:hypothetical protein